MICLLYVSILTIFSEIRRKKMTIIFSLQNMPRILLYPSSVAIILNGAKSIEGVTKNKSNSEENENH